MLLLKNSEQLGLRPRAPVVGRKDVGGRAFFSRLENRAFAFLVEVFQELLSVVREIAQRHEQASLLVIVVVAERPLHFGEWRGLSGAPARRVFLGVSGVGPFGRGLPAPGGSGETGVGVAW